MSARRGDALRSVAAWALGCVPVLHVWHYSGGAWRDPLILAGLAAVWEAALRTVAERGWGARVGAAVVGLAVLVGADRLAGPTPALLVVVGLALADGALVGWSPLPGTPRRVHRTAGPALVALVLAEVGWLLTSFRPVVLTGFALTAVLLEVERRAPDRLDPVRWATLRPALHRLRRQVLRRPRWLHLPTGGLSERARRWIAALTVGAVHALGVVPAMYRALYRPGSWTGIQDYSIHATAVGWIFPTWWRPVVPHFGLHLTSKLVSLALGTRDYRLGMLVVSGALAMAFGTLLWFVFATGLRTWPSRLVIPVASVATLAVAFFESPSTLLGWSYQAAPHFYMLITMPHLPTAIGNRVLSLGLFLVVVNHLTGRRTGAVGWLAVLATTATVFKPSFAPTLAFVAVIWSWAHRRDPAGVRRLVVMVFAFAVPVGLVSLWQLVVLKSQQVDPTLARTLVIAPFRELDRVNGWNPVFWSVLLFPMVASVAFFRTLRGSFEVRIAAWCLAVSAAIVLLLSFESEQLYTSDLLQFAQSSLLVFTIMVIQRLLEIAPTLDAAGRIRLVLVGLCLVPYLVGGTSLWVCQGSGACLVH